MSLPFSLLPLPVFGGVWFAWLFARQYAAVLGRAGAPKIAIAPLHFPP